MGRINTYPETTSPGSDDFLLLDGLTSGTRKMKASLLVDGVEGVKEDLTAVSGMSEIPFTNNTYYATSGDYIADRQTATAWESAMVECSAGDMFLINGHGVTNPVLYVFADSNYQIIARASADATVVMEQIIAPENSAYLVINNNDKTKRSYYYEPDNYVTSITNSLYDGVNRLNAIDSLDTITLVNGGYYTTPNNGRLGETVDTTNRTPSTAWNSAVISCAAGDMFLVTCSASANPKPYVFLDGNKKIIETPTESSVTNRLLTAPITASYLVINAYKSTRPCYKIDLQNGYKAIGTKEVVFVPNKYYLTSTDESNKQYINITAPTSSSAWKYALVSAKADDYFIINGNGSVNPKFYAFLDADFYVITSNDVTSAVNKLIKAPVGTAYLLINNRDKTAQCYSIDADGFVFKIINDKTDFKRTVTVKKDGSADYDSITEAVYNNPGCNVIVLAGTYDIIEEYKDLFGENVFDTLTESDYNYFGTGIRIDNCTIKFESGAIVTADYTGLGVDSTHRFCPFSLGSDVVVDGLVCDVTGSWYIIHDDYGLQNTPYHNEIKNCVLIGHSLVNYNAIGGGCKSDSFTVIDNCVIDTNDNVHKCARYHNTNQAGASPRVIVKNSKFNSNLGFNYYGSQTTKMIVMVNNCSINGQIVIAAETPDSITNNITLYDWCNNTAS